jgi:hypothetical protein
MSKAPIAAVSFVGSFAMALHAMALQFVTLATNDPHDYQPLLKSGLLWSFSALAVVALFVSLARGWWRVASAVPLALCGVAWWGIYRMWPYAFA